jgi:membrane-bound serine protease (ClpP class)
MPTSDASGAQLWLHNDTIDAVKAISRRPAGSFGFILVLLGALAVACSSDKPGDRVHVLTWDGDVNPIMARYIDRGISAAERSNARAVVLQLDTPGGLDSAMRDIIQRIESSEVPVIVYVSPSGGRAASAGTFITMSGHIAAMAPNTTIGAATPINSDGKDIEGALGRKVTNDAVAYIRGIAELRGRNADWAEKAVRDAVAVPQNEAVDLKVVDFIAGGLDDLLRQSDGRSTEVANGSGGMRPVTLHTAGAGSVDNGPNFYEELLNVIATPDIAFLLLSLGGLALAIELFHPTFFGGIFGVIALALAFVSLGSLPTNWVGVALIVFGFVLIISEIFVSGFGALGIGGIIALILGGLILTGSSDSGYQVSRWLVIAIPVVFGAFLVLFVGALVRMRRMPAHSGRESLLGAKGKALTTLNPRGVVWVAGERWDATAEDPPLDDETPIIVTASEGLKLFVKRDPASIKLLPVAAASTEEG